MPCDSRGVRRVGSGVFASLLLGAAPAAADERPEATAAFAHVSPRIDGRLDDAAWQSATSHGDFVERQPTLRAKPPVRTAFRVLFDAHAIYVGVRCDDDRADTIRAVTKGRDDGNLFSDDAISIKIDPTLDRRTTIGFVLNAAGARLDYRGINESDFRTEFDALWQGAVSRDAQGWSAEFRVPYQALGIDPANPPATIGLNLSRDHARRNATYDWALLAPPFSPIAASRYGTVTGFAELSDLVRSSDLLKNWAIVPYALTGFERVVGQEEANPREQGLFNAGVDVKARVGNWRGHATVNTDFAQVDLDNQVVNLTRFGLFLPEKRDFFLGDLEVLSFGRAGEAQMLYSRRIGLSGGEAIPILTGLKVVGRPTPSLRMGLLQVTTRPEGDTPWTSHGVGRTVVELGGGSNVGLMLAHRQSLEETSDRNSMVGVDSTLVGREVPILVKSFAIGSLTGEGAPDPDSAVGGDGRGAAADRWAPGLGLDLSLRHVLFRPSLSYAYFDPNLRGDLGFFQRVGIHDARAGMAIEPRIDSGGLSRINVAASGALIGDSPAEDLLDWRATGSTTVYFDAGFVAAAFLTHRFEDVKAPFLVGRETEIPAGPYNMWVGSLSLDTPATYFVSGSTFLTARDYYGGTLLEAQASLNLAPSSLVRWSVGGLYDHVTFERLPDFESAVINSRVFFGFTPWLGLRLFTGYNLLGDVLQLQSRLRWIYVPGSDVFIVTQVDLDDDGWRPRATSIIAKTTIRFPQ